MVDKNKRDYEIYQSLLGMILAFALILWVNDYYLLKVHILVCIIYSIVPSVLLYILDKNKNRILNYLLLLGLLPVGGLIFLMSRTNPITWASNIIEWVIRYDGSEVLYELAPAYTSLGILSLFGNVLLYIIVRYVITRLMLGALISTLLVVLSVLNIHTSKLVAGIAIFYILNVLIELSGILYGRKTGKRDKKESILYLLPLCILLAVIAVGLPSKNEPIQWTGFKTVYYTVKGRIDKLITQWEFYTGKGDGEFSISLSGYSDDGGLGNEDLESNHKIALIVTGRRGLSPIYLTGSINDIYTGDSWEKSKEGSLSDQQEYKLDYAELIYGLSRLDPQVFKDYRLAEYKSIKIQYMNIRTRTFFYPVKSNWFKFDNSGHELDMEYANIRFPKAKGDNITYNLSYYEMNLKGPEFQEMLRLSDDFNYNISRHIDYVSIELVKKALNIRDREKFVLNRADFYDLYRERAYKIYNSYTQLPDDLPTRVKDLAHEISKDEESNYDKLKAIEAYLLGYEYSYTPGKLPEGADFVDYFLFDNKKGYCTSFATAMAVLGRSIGIPTRYVEGFLVNYEDQNEIGYLVRNSNAHAWTEAYFEGVGWIPFEATPTFYEQRYRAWAPKKRYEDINPRDYYNRYEEIAAIDDIIDGGFEAIDNKDRKESIMIWMVIILATIIIVLVISISYYLTLRRRYWREYDQGDNSEKMYKMFLRILALLKYQGFNLGDQDTLVMLSDRIKDRYIYGDIVFADLVNMFMAYRYGEVPVTELQLEKMTIYYKGLKELHENESKVLKLHIEELLYLLKAKA